MDAVHLHLMLNHVPVIGTVLAVGLLAYALLRRSDEVTKVSLGLFAVVAVAGVAVFLTGEPAEEAVEGLAGVSEMAIERHEELAAVATILLGGLGLVSLAGLLYYRRRPSGIPRSFAWLVLVLALAPAAVMAYTANLGGQIRHAEIRSAQSSIRDAGGRELHEGRSREATGTAARVEDD